MGPSHDASMMALALFPDCLGSQSVCVNRLFECSIIAFQDIIMCELVVFKLQVQSSFVFCPNSRAIFRVPSFCTVYSMVLILGLCFSVRVTSITSILGYLSFFHEFRTKLYDF